MTATTRKRRRIRNFVPTATLLLISSPSQFVLSSSGPGPGSTSYHSSPVHTSPRAPLSSKRKVTSVRRMAGAIVTMATMVTAKTTKTAVATVYPQPSALFSVPQSSSSSFKFLPSTSTVTNDVKTAKTTTESFEIPKRVKDPQTPADILAFVSLTLASYIVGALLAIIFRALYKYVLGKYRRKTAMIKVHKTTGAECSLLGDPNSLAGRGRLIMMGSNNGLRQDQRRLSTIFEAPTGSYEGDDEMVVVGGGEDDFVIIPRNNSTTSMPSLVTQNNPRQPSSPCSHSYNSFLVTTSNSNKSSSPRKITYTSSGIPIIKMQPPSPQQRSNNSNKSNNGSTSQLPVLTSSPIRRYLYNNQNEQNNSSSPSSMSSFSGQSPTKSFSIGFSPAKRPQQYSSPQSEHRQNHNYNTPRTPTYIIECFGVGEDV